MNFNSIQLPNETTNFSLLNESISNVIDLLNQDSFFRFNYLKLQRRMNLIKLNQAKEFNKIILSHMFKEINGDGLFLNLPSNFFKNEEDFNEKLNFIKNSIVIVNNNDVHVNGDVSLFEKFIDNSPLTIFCAWDFDNHHWLSLSCKLASLVDFYTPSHLENIFILAKFNPTATFVTFCATIQWSTKFLNQNKETMLKLTRSNDLLGKHIFYSKFKYRSSVIKTISLSHPHVNFSNVNFHSLTQYDKLKEWMSYKAHLIVPVLNDIPIRVFDAWNTGGIPILPVSIKGYLNHLNINDNDICYYNENDILNFTKKLTECIFKFNESGIDGIKRRIEFGVNYHHAETRIKEIIKYCKNFFLINH
jgi:hypothetical protein